MKSERYSAWQGFVRALNLPEDAFLSQSHIEVFGQRELVVEGVREIAEYSEDLVRIRIKERTVVVKGFGMKIDMFREKAMIIRGNIEAVLFE